MRRKTLVIVLILLIGGTLVFGFTKSQNLSKKTTIKQLQKMKSEHGELLSVSYYHGGGMNGDTYSRTIKRNEEGQAILTVRSSSEHWIPVRVWEYLIEEEDVFDRFRAYSDEYNLPAWKDLPFDEEHIALDAPSSSISLSFNDSEYGGWRNESYSISYENVIPEGGYEVLNGFVSLIGSYEKKENLIGTYLDDDGEQIFTGKDIENTDEEVGKLITGYWRSEKKTVDSNTEDPFNDYSLDVSSYVDEIELFRKGEDKFVFQKGEIIHEPLGDYDSSWYLILIDQDDPGNLYCLTAVQDRLYLEKKTGNEVIEFSRY